MQYGLIGCAICGKPLRLAAAKAENGGLPIHEGCYLLRLKLKQGHNAPKIKRDSPKPGVPRRLLNIAVAETESQCTRIATLPCVNTIHLTIYPTEVN